MKIIVKYLACLVVFSAVSQGIIAQQKNQPNPKFKPPVVKVYLGGHQNGDSISKETAKLLLPLPLQILDNKKNEYSVENYRFLYRKKSYIPNPDTGKDEITFTISAGIFTETPLPKIWIDNVGLNLLQGEEYYFFDIIVKDKQGNRFLAPNFKLIISK
jgi:hypothetical protein